MKFNKLTTAVIAAVTAITPLSMSAPALAPATVFADEKGDTARLPDWVPNDYHSAVEFRNTYGATHIEGRYVCIVYQIEYEPTDPVNYIQFERYQFLYEGISLHKESEDFYTYSEKPAKGDTVYCVMLFSAGFSGEFEVDMTDRNIINTSPDTEHPHSLGHYSFNVDSYGNITETDIYSWLPDSMTEFGEYVRNNGEVSAKDNYVVFCTTAIEQFGDRWEPDSNNNNENFKYLLTSNCTMEDRKMYEDGSIDRIYVYQAVKDGDAKLTWTRTSGSRPGTDEPQSYTLTADCAVIDDAQTVLLANTARIRFVNADTLEPTDIPTGNEPFQLSPIIAYKDKQKGTYEYADLELFADSNPFYWDFSEYTDADIFNIDVMYKSVRPYYWLQDKYKKETRYENGARDIVFMLKPNPEGIQKDTVRFTFVDSETGEPVEFSGNAEEFRFEASISYFNYGNPYLTFIGEFVTPASDPCIWDVGLSASAGLDLSDINSFYLNAAALPEGYELKKDEIKKTVYENNAMDVIVPLKYTPTGDVNDDGEFTVADVVAVQGFLLGRNSVPKWKNADFNGNNKTDVFDLILMKRELFRDTATQYVKPDHEILYGADLKIIADEAAVYLGPDTSYDKVTTIPKGTVLTERGVQNNNNNWAFIEYKGQYGWIQMVTDDGETQVKVEDLPMPAKPVIYLYPEEETDVHVELELTEAALYTTYPKYNNGWDVTAYPDGTLLNKADGTHHKYLFWDAVNCRTKFDFSKGFCVAGSDTEAFLREKLTYMGLNEQEMNEFIVYWLPLMEHNAYNLISFQGETYTDTAKLDITPAPDSLLRIFMTYVPLEEAVDIEPQQLDTFERNGFTVVEWGGCDIR